VDLLLRLLRRPESESECASSGSSSETLSSVLDDGLAMGDGIGEIDWYVP